ncbi:queuosine precursor transporter [Desulfocurvus sp. DL9XJH121]
MDCFQRRAHALLLALFTGGLVCAALISSKIITVCGVTVPAGVLAYSLTFAASDVVGEVWGRERAGEMVLAGFAALVMTSALSWLAVAWPSASFWDGQHAFARVVGSTPRIVAASLAAYAVSQTHDVWLFHLLKNRTHGRHLWLRNNLSTMVSQGLDSAIFVTVAFYGILPVGPIILGQWLVKLAIAALDTPVVCGLSRVLQGRAGAVGEA